jgi:hypothetical protein
MTKQRKTPRSSPTLKQILLILIFATFVLMMLVLTMLSTDTHHDFRPRSKMRTTGDEKRGIMSWQFSEENIQKEPQLYKMLSSFSIDSSSLKALKLESPGVPGTTMLNFFAKNPGWLSERTFTADVFTCPPNSHEGFFSAASPCTHRGA